VTPRTFTLPWSGRRPPQDRPASTTRKGLLLRLWALLALTVAGMVALSVAYQGVHRNSGPLRTSSAPAVIEVATARRTLDQTQKIVEGRLPGDVETGISVADQSLAQAASRNVTGTTGGQTLHTLVGLMVTYNSRVEQAENQDRGLPLRDAYVSYARSTLRRSGTGIIPRLERLQGTQRAVVDRQASFGWAQWLSWGAALVLLVALAGLLVETQFYLRRRFRRRFNPWLAAATAVLVLGVTPLVAATVRTQLALEASRDRLVTVTRTTDHQEITRAQEYVRSRMDGTKQWATAVYAVPVEGVALGALVVAGMWRRVGEYRFQPR
jgi:hypothetical protein